MSETVKKSKKQEKPKKTVKQEIISWILTLGAAVAIALVIRSFLFIPVMVNGESMQNTLMNKEIVVATKPEVLAGNFEHDEIVICHYPNRGSTLFVKRLVGLPGDTLEIVGGTLIRNGEVVDETDMDCDTLFFGSMEAITLGEDEYFVMGDNRGNSNDSRNKAVGTLSRSQIVAHVQRIVWPLSKFWTKVE